MKLRISFLSGSILKFTHHYLAQRLRISGAILLLLLCAVIVVNREKFTLMGLLRRSLSFVQYEVRKVGTAPLSLIISKIEEFREKRIARTHTHTHTYLLTYSMEQSPS
jgi:hypothetical protein